MPAAADQNHGNSVNRVAQDEIFLGYWLLAIRAARSAAPFLTHDEQLFV
jgi:hypothetical protein